ncbi:MAG TPA: 23S rRNA (adenine(2503)-C(2))-methyltransferase RlmN [Tepidisphaeraceae bacterium]|nr:23S rRNA (adenine(2503)-C(2))-methyltransferase RlmN [Tepidisphaeraceae bacterium]
MPSLSDFDVPDLADVLASWGHPRTHAAPLLRHFYNTAGDLPDDGRVGPALLTRLRAELVDRTTTIAARRQATDGTVKLLVAVPQTSPTDAPTAHRRLPTAHSSTVECVLMPSHLPDRAAGCVSSQIGCAMGCDFCASTKAGVERSLTAGEIVEQFLHLRREGVALGRRLRTIVFMGMGEPMLNYDNVAAAIRRIAGDDLGALGFRHVTVSTVGIVPGIDRLRTDNLGVHLAVSLHAPDDDTRAAIVPTGRRYRVADILAAVRRYQADSGQIATIEYTLLDGVNDSDVQAQLLADLLNHGGPDPRAPRAQRPRVNLIPYNAIGPGVSGREYRRPPEDRVRRFLEILRHSGIVAHARRTRGHDIDGACGQLRETLSTTAR